jgi:hypothetical protein
MKRSGHTLVATMFAVVIMLMLAMVMLKGGLGGSYAGNTGSKPRADGLGGTMPTYMKLKAEDEACRSNIRQARQAVSIARISSGDQPPATIEETGMSEQFLTCPIGHEKYQYDPTSGNVTCPHPGHEKY